jgi:tetratricopeptide (TPR) repeat protein
VHLLPPESPFRLELLVDLGETYAQTGRFDDAAVVLDEAISRAVQTGEARFEVRARLERAQVDRFRGVEGAIAGAAQAARQAVAVLEPLGDDAGLARAWRTLVLVEVVQGRFAAASEASENVIRHAQAAGDARIASRAATPIAYILLHGPAPVATAIPQCEDLLASVKGDRKTEAVIAGTLGVLRAMRGEFAEARALYQQGQAMLEELGGGIDAASTSLDSHRVEVLAGDLAAAERELRRDYDSLLALDETFFRSTISAHLAYVRLLAGDPEEAIVFSATAEAIGEADDAELGTLWRIARAPALAIRGEAEAARTLAEEAVALARTTERSVLQAQALVALGQVGRELGDPETQSGPPLREALALFEAKGDEVSAARIRELVAQPA